MFSESTKLKVQQFGRFLSNMVMPNIGAFIAWGFITALFIKTGWFPVAALGGFGEYEGKGIVGPMITYLLPLHEKIPPLLRFNVSRRHRIRPRF